MDMANGDIPDEYKGPQGLALSNAAQILPPAI
jgi:hypothetical protein